MISSLSTSLARVTIFWYIIGLLVMFFGHPDWAEAGYLRVAQLFPWVPQIEFDGLSTAGKIQWSLITYWTFPVLIVWAVALLFGAGLSEIKCQLAMNRQLKNLRPNGEFAGVKVASYSLGQLPLATTPGLEGSRISLTKRDAKRGDGYVELKGAVASAAKLLNPAERLLCEQLLQVLSAKPDHYAGLGHGVGLLAHTLNVVSQAASKVTPEFRLPLIAALAHDVGKLVTFIPDGAGGWKRKGLHSRESARIVATLSGFLELPELHRDALLLAIKYDHNPNKMPFLRGDRESHMLALRVINALSQADKAATAEEKERHLERLQPEDVLFQDFCTFLREAPIATRGKKGTANMVNNPPDNDFIFIYEAAWREAAISRLAPEIAAALDLNRRDSGKLAKYTKILTDRLRKEGLLVEQHLEMSTSDVNPLWDIQSGNGEKAVVFRGVLALRAEPLWAKLNYKLSVKSPFPVTILAPNANADGKVNAAPRADTSMGGGVPEVNDGIKLDISSPEAMAALGLAPAPGDGTSASVVARKPKTRSRAAFQSAEPTAAQDSMFGLVAAAPKKTDPVVVSASVPPTAAVAPPAEPKEDTIHAETESQLPGNDASSTSVAPAPEVAAAPAPASEPHSENSAQPTPVDSLEAGMPAGIFAHEAPVQTQQAPAPAESTGAAPVKSQQVKPAVAELSRTEKKAGLAIADQAAVAQYPHLKLGDKFYTESALEVVKGTFPAGRKYKESAIPELSERGPRRNPRRFS